MRQECWTTTLTSTCVLPLSFVPEGRGFKGSSNEIVICICAHKWRTSVIQNQGLLLTLLQDHALKVQNWFPWSHTNSQVAGMLCLKMSFFHGFQAWLMVTISTDVIPDYIGSSLLEVEVWRGQTSADLSYNRGQIWFLLENNHRENCCCRHWSSLYIYFFLSQKENGNRR